YDKYNDRLVTSYWAYKDAGITSNGTYEVSKDGTVTEKEIISEQFNTFIPSEVGLWAFTGAYENINGENVWNMNTLINLDDIKSEYYFIHASDYLSIGDLYGGKDHQIVGDYIYISLCGNYNVNDDDGNCLYTYPLYEFYRFNMKTKEVENILKDSDYTERLNVSSWSVNETTFYYSGTYSSNDTPINGKVDLSSSNFTHTVLDSSQNLSCLSAL
nr:hypothetical protein [Treponema sp.]